MLISHRDVDELLAERGIPVSYETIRRRCQKFGAAFAVYTAAGYRPDGSDRVSDFRGTRLRELRLVRRL